MQFRTDKKYSRASVLHQVGLNQKVKGGAWFTGVVKYNNEFFIFANVGNAGRTGHDYHNQWRGNFLQWYHRKNSQTYWPSVKQLLRPGCTIHLFSRTDNRSLFEYHGYAIPVDVVENSSPVEILLAVSPDQPEAQHFGVADLMIQTRHLEGTPQRVEVTRYERDRRARQECIDHYGPTCTACGLTFEDRYGEIGRAFIQVHHLVPISELSNSYEVDPIEDLRPICPNCHAMVHRRTPPYSVEYVREALKVQESQSS